MRRIKVGQIISGKELSKTIRKEVKEQVIVLTEKYHRMPHLAVVLVGDDPASKSYVRAKERACEKAMIKSTVILKNEDTSEEELLQIITKLNDDETVDGILVQLPLPKQINEDKVIDAIKLEKDVDGFHPLNLAYMHLGRHAIYPATPKGIMTMIKRSNIQLKGKKALVVGRSNIVGKPVAMMLLKEHATVTIAHSRTENLKAECLAADIIVAAVGKPKMITADMVKEGATIIDVGVNRVDGKLVGDVDFDALKDKVSYITPVPGGVGPMTITSLLQNTLECYERRVKQ
jgi:methylenetetrahydrofolate dehydrogenase (NADP+)/methenyltetrahydrofolate cyclohydrolase